MIRLYVGASLDGYIADTDGGLAWLDPFHTDEAVASYNALVKDIGAIVTGRLTFEQLLTFGPWPYETLRTVVVSSRELDDLPPNTEVVSVAALPATITELRRRDGDVWLMGGGQTVSAFLELGEIDQIELCVIPVLLGDGVPLFPAGAPSNLRLVSTETWPQGMVMLQYRLDAADAIRES